MPDELPVCDECGDPVARGQDRCDYCEYIASIDDTYSPESREDRAYSDWVDTHVLGLD